MEKLVPIKVIQSVEMIYDLLNEPFTKFSLFTRTNKVNFDEKLKFVKSLSEKDVTSAKFSIQQRIVLAKILEGVLKEINSKFYNKPYVNAQSDLGAALVEFQGQLVCLMIRYEEVDNRVLLHYSAIPTYSRDWNNSTRVSRGLVIDLDTYSVIVHPYNKFFNYTETKETKKENLPDVPYEVATKLDGSEGILYPSKNGDIRIITKGAFNSEQGQFATTVLWSKYKEQAENIKARRLYNNHTLTFEILYAKNDPNRIVVAYDEADLRLIGVRDLQTGRDLSYTEVIKMAKELGFPHTELEDLTLEEIMEERKTRENFEGWVIRFENGLYMKIKCEPYLDLHGARFGSSVRTVWRLLKEGKWDDFIASVPEEIKPIPLLLHKKVMKFVTSLTREIQNVYYTLPAIESQKEFSLYVRKNVDLPITPYMFQLREGQDIDVIKTITSWVKFRDQYAEWEEKQNVE